jgi:hypothetical protein
MFNQIKLRELPTWAKVYRTTEPNMSSEEILAELTLIDDLLTIQKSQSLLLKRGHKFKLLLEGRIAKELGHNTIELLNRKKQKPI